MFQFLLWHVFKHWHQNTLVIGDKVLSMEELFCIKFYTLSQWAFCRMMHAFDVGDTEVSLKTAKENGCTLCRLNQEHSYFFALNKCLRSGQRERFQTFMRYFQTGFKKLSKVCAPTFYCGFNKPAPTLTYSKLLKAIA